MTDSTKRTLRRWLIAAQVVLGIVMVAEVAGADVPQVGPEDRALMCRFLGRIQDTEGRPYNVFRCEGDAFVWLPAGPKPGPEPWPKPAKPEMHI